jgi:AraC family transcriptional regulator
MGTTPARHVAEVRLAAAKRLLGIGHLDIGSIAAACGYAHQQHFTNRFKASTGLTPSQFRAAAGP